MKPASEWAEEIVLWTRQDRYAKATALKKAITTALRQARDEAILEFCEGDRSKLAEYEQAAYVKGRDEGAKEEREKVIKAGGIIAEQVYNKGRNEALEEAANVFSFAIETQTMLVKEVGNPSTKRDLDILVMYRDKIRALKSSSQGKVDSR